MVRGRARWVVAYARPERPQSIWRRFRKLGRTGQCRRLEYESRLVITGVDEGNHADGRALPAVSIQKDEGGGGGESRKGRTATSSENRRHTLRGN